VGFDNAEDLLDGGNARQAEAINTWKRNVAGAAHDGLNPNEIYRRFGNLPSGATGFLLNASAVEIARAYEVVVERTEAELRAVLSEQRETLVEWCDSNSDRSGTLVAKDYLLSL
jgi:hypothetical protein